MDIEKAKQTIREMLLHAETQLLDYEAMALQTVLNELDKKDKIIKQLKEENHNLKEQLQMFIPRRRVRRVYKMLGKILRTDIDTVLLEKELKEENK